MPIPKAKESPFNPDELQFLYRIAQSLLREADYGELLADLLDLTIKAVGAERGFVLAREGGKVRASIARNFRSEALPGIEEEVSSSIAEMVLREGKALLISDASTSTQFRNRESVRRLELRSVLCAPVMMSNEAFALIYLDNREISNFFTEDHRRLLDEICTLSSPRLRVAVSFQQARRRAAELESSVGSMDGIVTADQNMSALLNVVSQVAGTELPVLIQGETGTGKELIARALYRRSKRDSGPFVVINCAALPSNLIESELFGYARGAFTGAVRDRTGLIGAAHRGTLLLDEIGELPLELQTRLLRVLQSGEFNRLGSVETEIVDVRFIAATNRDLEREVEEGRFRSDLYFRLSALPLRIPPLRERPGDIPLLIEHFLRTYAGRWGRGSQKLSDDCLRMLLNYQFPGNVRELENEVARLVALASVGAVIDASSLSERVRNQTAITAAKKEQGGDEQPVSLLEMEKRVISAALAHTRGNRTQAAEILGISREGLRVKMQRLGLTDTCEHPPQMHELS